MVRTHLRVAVQSCLALVALLLFDFSSAFGQSGNPFFVPPTLPGSEQAISADVNGDGKPDMVFLTERFCSEKATALLQPVLRGETRQRRPI